MGNNYEEKNFEAIKNNFIEFGIEYADKYIIVKKDMYIGDELENSLHCISKICDSYDEAWWKYGDECSIVHITKKEPLLLGEADNEHCSHEEYVDMKREKDKIFIKDSLFQLRKEFMNNYVILHDGSMYDWSGYLDFKEAWWASHNECSIYFITEEEPELCPRPKEPPCSYEESEKLKKTRLIIKDRQRLYENIWKNTKTVLTAIGIVILIVILLKGGCFGGRGGIWMYEDRMDGYDGQ